MRPSLRFLALAIVGWAGFRAWTAGVLPTGVSFLSRSEAKPAPAIVPTEFPQVEPVQPATPNYATANVQQPPIPVAPPPPAAAVTVAVPPAAVRYVQGAIGVPVAMRRGVVTVYQVPKASPVSSALPPLPARFASETVQPAPAFYSKLPSLDEFPLAHLAGLSRPTTSSSPVIPTATAPINPKTIKRLQITSWALLRSQQGGLVGSSSLAAGGQLGASQAGARLTYNFSRRIAASFRTTTEVGRRGGEVAAGVRIQPFVNIPVWVTAERRQRLGRFSDGRDAFAIFLEGGVYDRPMPWRFDLNTYLQGGFVGRDAFVDGGLTLTRPLFRNFSAGFGIWGAAQPGLYRLDAGPRLTMKVRNNVRLHLDWRQRLAGNARPGSGLALTLAGDF